MADPPKWTEPPYKYSNGHEPEPVSGILYPKTGKTRRRAVKQGVVLTAAMGLLSPLVYAVVDRLGRPGPLVVIVVGDAKDAGQ